MSSEIAGAVAGIRLLLDVLKANKTLTNYNELVSAVAEVNAELLSAQGDAVASYKSELALTKRVSELEKEIAQLKNWEREAERYQLTDLTPGIPARVLKPGMENGESTHPLCANCFERSKKSFLQYGPRAEEKSCNQCAGSWSPAGREPKRADVW